MKIIFLIALASIGVISVCSAQKISSDKVPAVVKSSFKTKFPTVKKADWEMEKSDYEANFKIDGKETSANFDANGNWLETEIEIKTSELPSEVRIAVISYFEEYKLKEASMIESAEHGKCYEAEVEKGEETLDALFAPDGKLISKSVVESKDKDKD